MKQLTDKQKIILKKLGFAEHRPEPIEAPNFTQFRLNVPHKLFKGMYIEVDANNIHIYCREGMRKGYRGKDVLIYVATYTYTILIKVMKSLDVK